MRLNGIIRALESGPGIAFTSFMQAEIENAVNFAQASNDGLVFEMEHNPWDIQALRVAMQFLLLREQIVKAGSLANPMTPMVRIPANGSEMNQWFAKQALDLGAYGIVWPRISNSDEAYNAVAACRYPRQLSREPYEPAGLRGDAPMAAARYWGLSQAEYYKRADVWPLVPEGEILVGLMIEDSQGVNNIEKIVKEVPGIGLLLLGEGDLTQELGCPRDYENPELLRMMAHVLEVGKAHGIAVGHPHMTKQNAQTVIDQGYRFLMSYPRRDFSALEAGRNIVKGL